ncbi:MAG: glucose-1-phosphate cytidylyltransferase [Verrucomicrobiae bacterium]|nr:glucose-1-phosphate cytidylyltransferase [Verrucomicrobiae bacterium]
MKSEDRINVADVPVVILAGGRGTRLMEETHVIPKPMVTIGGQPILLHIMQYYSSFGFRKFIICLGYKGHIIKEYFLDMPKHTADLFICGPSKQCEYIPSEMSEWQLHLVETGAHSLTATRLRVAARLIQEPHFCLTYGDGLSDVDLDAELLFHLHHGKLGTVAAVHPPSRFGRLDIHVDGQVMAFKEKESLDHDYINGGFFIFKHEFLKRLSPVEDQSLESQPLTRLAEDGQLCAFKHEHFWKCMDTIRDRNMLEDFFKSGNAPWTRRRARS